MSSLPTHHLKGLGDPRGEHADTEEDEESGAEADGGDDAETEGFTSLQLTRVRTTSYLVCFEVCCNNQM